jgi:hypothetical protein
MVSNMLYGKKIAEAMKAMHDEAHSPEGTTRDIRSRRQDMVNEYQKRLDNEMKSPPPSKVMDNVLRLNSFYRLALSPMHYAQYLLQPFAMAHPLMGGRFGYGKAAAAHVESHMDVLNLAKKTGNFLNPDFTKLTSKVGDEVGALGQLRKMNVLESDHAGDYGDSKHFTNTVMSRIEKLTDYPARIARGVETNNRISTALASYRLAHADALQRGLSTAEAHDAGLKFAADVVRRAYGDYSAANSPRVLQPGQYGNGMGGTLSRAVTQFKKFTVIHSALAAGMMHESLRGTTPAERVAARKSLAFMYGHYALMAGAMGVPGATVAMALYNKLFGDDGDTPETTARKAIGDNDVADLLLHGAPALGGADVTDKLGVGELPMPIRFSTQGSARQVAGNALIAAAGPLASTSLNLAAGLGKIQQGDYMGGMHDALPPGIRGFIDGIGASTDGVQNRAGLTIQSSDDMTMLQALMKGIGAKTIEESRAEDQARSVQGETAAFSQQANDLKKSYAQAWKDGDKDAMGSAMDGWMDMQSKMRDAGFARVPHASEMTRAAIGDMKKQMGVLNGVPTTKKTRGFVQQLQEEEGQSE